MTTSTALLDPRTANGSLSVLIVEPHEICRRALRDLIGNDARLRMAGETASVRDAVDAAGAHDPTAIVVGLDHDGDAAGIGDLRTAYPSAAILVLAAPTDGELPFNAIRLGARGLLSNSAPPSDVAGAIVAVASGGAVFDAGMSTEALLWAAGNEDAAPVAPQPENPGPALTQRESQILGSLAEGLNAGAIANELGLSRRTVETHLANAYRKLGVHGRFEALRKVRDLIGVS